MTIPTITAPAGIERPIQKLQIKLGTALGTAFGVADYHSFGRAFRNPNKKGDGYIPEIYLGNKEYADVFSIDTVSGMNFFYVDADEDRIGQTDWKATANIVFFLNLKKLFPTKTHRAASDAEAKIIDILETAGFGFNVLSLHRGIDNVYRDFKYESAPMLDMQPYFVLKVKCSLIYQMTEC